MADHAPTAAGKRTAPDFAYAEAVCYSGYREGQSPADSIYPSYEQVAEDLGILARHWRYIRLYDCSRHAELVLDVVRDEGLDLRVMLGANMRAESSNPRCPWGADFGAQELAWNRRENSAEIDRLAALANRHAESVFAVSIGNEATVDWTDHPVPVERLVGFAQRLRGSIAQPVTFCENYVPWAGRLAPLAAELDFISVHTYPVWEYKSIDEALDYTRLNYESVADRYPDKPVVIAEAGWTTGSNGRGIEPDNASEELQARYYRQLTEWARDHGILTFVFEAFDEPWKGSPDPLEPEKHWGLFTVDRRPKPAVQDLFADLPR